MAWTQLRILLVGPLPPPQGGMARQTQMLADFMRAEGASVRIADSNAPVPPKWQKKRGWRAVYRLLAHCATLWHGAAHSDIVHIMANSGWSWHLHAVPAIWIGRLRRCRVVVHYRGGAAADFLARSARLVGFSLYQADALLFPSRYLARVFSAHGWQGQCMPNVLKLPVPRNKPAALRILLARHLEAIYDHATALRACAQILEAYPHARVLVAGDGPLRQHLEQLCHQLGIAHAVDFLGDVADMQPHFHAASLLLNASLIDNSPNTILEAWAQGVLVVSSRAGGIPDLVEDQENALLVPCADPNAMAAAALRLLRDRALAERLCAHGLARACQHSWQVLGPRLLRVYETARAPGRLAGFVCHTVFKLQEWTKGHHSFPLLAQYEQSQWSACQNDGLASFLADVRARVPYFARLASLEQAPVQTKAMMRAAGAELIARDASGLSDAATGGSSGEPLQFKLGKARISADIAARRRAMRWWGVDVGEPEVVVWGSPIELGAQDRLRVWRDRLLRSTLLAAFDMAPASLDRFIATIEQVRPRMLFGYPSALSLIARHAQARGVRLDRLGIRVVFVTSERLYDEQRAQISTVFACPVSNGYGGRETGCIAQECPDGGMHIASEAVHIEIMGPDGAMLPAGQMGEIIVTNLASADYPFIRYATGDIGALSTRACPCGRTLPMLDKLEGRSTDFVHAQNGVVLHGLALIYILRELSEIQAFKIVQEDRNLTRVLLVTAAGVSVAMHAHITTSFRARLGATVLVQIEEVSVIPPEASGKFRYVISHVRSPDVRLV